MPVADLVLNTGTYAWDIPDDLAVADDYRLTLTLNEDSAASNTRKTISCISGQAPFFMSVGPEILAHPCPSLFLPHPSNRPVRHWVVAQPATAVKGRC